MTLPDLTGSDLAGSALLEALPAPVYVTDAEGFLTYFNPAATALWGNTPTAGVARWCGSWKLYRDDGTPLPLEECPTAITLKTGEEIRGVEVFVERPSGKRVRILPQPRLLRDSAGNVVGTLNLVLDITDLHSAEVDSERLAAIVANSDDAIVSKTLDGIITFWNDSAARIFGYTAEEMIGQSILKIIPPELHGEEREVLARLTRGERIDHYETVRVARDGRRVDVSLTVSPLREKSGRIIGASKVARDITDRKQFEKQQLLLMGELSHRVKNTLATVQAIATQSLRRSRDPADFVSGFSGRIFSLAKAHQLLSETRWEGVELAALVEDQVLLGVADDRVTWNGPRVNIEAQAALHLAMVLHELGTNARKYGALSVQRGKLTIEWRVVDTADRRELSLEWRESDGPRASAPTHKGFGTILIEESLVAHGGGADLEYGSHGFVCRLRLPLSIHRDEGGAYGVPRLPLSAQDQAHRARLHGKRILVVEDEPIIAMEIAATLTDGGCIVVGPVGDLDDALRLISEDGATACDAALLDANLGGQRVDALAAALTRVDIPFAFLTGYGAEALPPAFRHAPLVTKPFGKNELLSTVAVVVQRKTELGVTRLDSAPRNERQR